MKKAIIMTAFGLLLMAGAFAQDAAFEKYSQVQDSLFTIAYNNRDVSTYERLLQGYEKRYRKLDAKTKKEFESYNANVYYNLSCAYSLLNNKDAALANLQKSIHAGLYDYQHMQKDSDLDNIRSEQRYAALMQQVRPIGDYSYILNHAAAFNQADQRVFPRFTYQSKDDSNLVALRKTFNLDSIAGKANEVSKIINLMRWVHNYIPHDGTHGNPSVYDAMNMMAVCKKEERGLNCRGLATVLNEFYLAMGFPSRLVTCLPKDSLGIDQDCHVINAVYSKQLKKWIWMDPTNEAYVMNEKGELLGIQEVRQRLIHGETLIVNPDANWNHKSTATRAHYLDYYMTKNLYRLECPVDSRNNLEKRGQQLTYVELLPLDYFDQSPDKTTAFNEKNNTTFVRYKTNNPDKFWQAPEDETAASVGKN
ncbi:transglutaminase-like domain-containing protein [Polluticoccus soli]|uniref:transglutaminase-like domain-containing protein n=1 Tax=Polluticoccus soli TaxID=3034150 RepID=UPI0023E2543B|nr:transglutaminase-like domain-containing protein [Flavipsychrobacter sp. JY13-12]